MLWKPRKGGISRMEGAIVLIAAEKGKRWDLLIWHRGNSKTISVVWCGLRILE